ncbi:hypothetical protein OHA84_00585 [Streptomyces sp. NBC_00513]|uniref:hypothetical protein n=1 Tax=unclassified Streptomyces TaxID=2593676 RepID=UPI002251B5FB|nr:hypothetical protein [Streptomyces sp. NBC_00424]MCX5078680.1 hypothetical protein [Streptomyces sp. NBC_00424]WUD39123.1 hypothetical protein OHA84_00585 [Streptomyces sp. NBC_00513]
MDVRRVYGSSDGSGEEPAPRPDHVYAELLGGPLDGLLLDVTGWSGADRVEGALLITDKGLYGPGGRAFYAPVAGDVEGLFLWRGDTP